VAALTDWQYDEMAARPDMIVQFARHLEDGARQSLAVEELKVKAAVAPH
jgi:hypothetical protein